MQSADGLNEREQARGRGKTKQCGQPLIEYNCLPFSHQNFAGALQNQTPGT